MKSIKTVSSGFTLSEVMLALFVLSSTMFILSELQMKSIIKVWYGREEIDRLYTIKKYAYKGYLKPKKIKKTEVKQLERPVMKISLAKESIGKKSALAPWGKYLKRIISRGEWDRLKGHASIEIVTLVNEAPKQEEQ